MRDGNAEILGRLHPEGVIFEDRPVPMDDLRRLGWKYSQRRGWEQRWVLNSDLDRTDLRRVFDATAELLTALHNEDPGAYVAKYRPAGEEDAGDAQIGCLFAVASCVVGDVLGIVVTVLRHEPIPVVGMSVFAGTMGLLLGFVGFGSLAPRLLALSARLRGRAAEISTTLLLVIPGVVTLLIWLVAPAVGPLSDEQLLIVPGALIIGTFVLTFIFVPVLLFREARTKRRDDIGGR